MARAGADPGHKMSIFRPYPPDLLGGGAAVGGGWRLPN
jgi:hypothetical protein